jgi:amino acid permease
MGIHFGTRKVTGRMRTMNRSEDNLGGRITMRDLSAIALGAATSWGLVVILGRAVYQTCSALV